ncbi:MAG: ABC transporter substrate-binding protein [Paludibacteraceae bacterium]|nr:ABC transporter substrate-binding protein [Paludibacteraceae bacterium]
MLLKFLKFSLLFLAIILLSCDTNEPNTIRFGVLDGPSAISIVKLSESELYFGGKKLEIIQKNDPQQIQAMMMRDKLDFAILPTVMAANLFNRGVRYRMLACPVWGTLYILTNNKDVQSIADLQGKSIAVFGQGATPDVLLKREFQRRAIKNVRLEYTYNSNQAVSQALLQKNIENAVVSEPLVSILLQKDKEVKIVKQLECVEFFRSTDIDIFVQSAFVVSDRFIKKHPELISEISNAYAMSCNFINEHPSKAAQILIEKALLPDEQTALLALPLCNIRYVSAFAIEREINQYLDIFYDFNPETTAGKTKVRDFIFQ